LENGYDAMKIGFIPEKTKSSTTETPQEALKVPKTRSKVRKPALEESLNHDDMDVDDNDDTNTAFERFDNAGLPAGSITSGNGLNAMAESMKSSPSRTRPISRGSTTSSKSLRLNLTRKSSDGLTSTPAIDHETQAEESDDSSSDGSSDSDYSSESSSDDEPSSAKSKGGATDTSTSGSEDDSSDSSSDGSSDSDEEPEESSSKLYSNLSASPQKSLTPSKMTPRQPAAGQGKTQTRKRNERRRVHNTLARYKEKGILPAGITVDEFHKLGLRPDSSPEEAVAALKAIRATKKGEESISVLNAKTLEARREELLASIASGGVEVGVESSDKVKKPQKSNKTLKEIASSTAESHATIKSPVPTPELKKTSAENSIERQQPSASLLEATPDHPMEAEIGTPHISSTPKPATSIQDIPNSAESSRSLSRSGLRSDAGAAARRMIIAGLGMKTPKTKQDEDRLRNHFMKNIRPVTIPKVTEQTPPVTVNDVVDEDPDAWRNVINYRAVECCHDGIELSEPPFPFVQRWDPQQQVSKPGCSKRKRNQRNQEQYYDEPSSSKKQQLSSQEGKKGKRGTRNTAQTSLQDWNTEINAYEELSFDQSFQEDSFMQNVQHSHENQLPNDSVKRDVNKQPMKYIIEGASTVPDDLALLPEDPSTLPDLSAEEVKVGMTIAFKQMEMTEAWTPQISTYKTAIVIFAPEGGELHLALAQRDRKQSTYDVETGEKIYGKFEMPMEDDEDEDEGKIYVTLDELIEPKIVAVYNSDIEVSEGAGDGLQLEGNPRTDGSFTLNQDEDSAGAQFSHVTETPLHSDAQEPELNSLQEESLVSQQIDHELHQEFVPQADESDLPEEQETSEESMLPDRQMSQPVQGSVQSGELSLPERQISILEPEYAELDESVVPEPKVNQLGRKFAQYESNSEPENSHVGNLADSKETRPGQEIQESDLRLDQSHQEPKLTGAKSGEPEHQNNTDPQLNTVGHKSLFTRYGSD
jgi:hypothetical protein